MPKLQIIQQSDIGVQSSYPVPGHVHGLVGSKLISPEDYTLWLCRSQFEDGGTIEWAGDNGDEGVYLISGSVEVDGHLCQPGGGLIVEAGARGTATVRGSADLIHVGQWKPKTEGGGHIHVVGPEGWFASGDRMGVTAIWLADSTCDTCDITLFAAAGGPGAGGMSPPHSHSEDEIIHILRGTLFLGEREFGEGTSLCIPHDVRYKLGGGPHDFAYINYRPGNATATRFVDGKPVNPEPGHAMARNGRATLDVVHLKTGG